MMTRRSKVLNDALNFLRRALCVENSWQKEVFVVVAFCFRLFKTQVAVIKASAAFD